MKRSLPKAAKEKVMKNIFRMSQNHIESSTAMRILKGSSIIGLLIVSLILYSACENPADPPPAPQSRKPPVPEKPPAPENPEKAPPAVSLQSYEAVEKGMTPAQIDTLIGSTGTRGPAPAGGAHYLWQDPEHKLKKTLQVWFTRDDEAQALIFHDSTNPDAIIHLARDFNANSARDFTRAQYNGITKDMILSEVNTILGFSGTRQFQGTSGGKPIENYVWRASIFKEISVTFIDDKAASKALTDRSVYPNVLNYTPLPGGVSQVSYEAVEKGMTPAQIDTLIGSTGTRGPAPAGGAHYLWQDPEHKLKKTLQVWFTRDDEAQALIFHDSTNPDAIIHLARDFNANSARDFTRAQYNGITKDMILSEVNTILGFSGTRQYRGSFQGKTMENYVWRASIFKNISVTFIDGKAASKILTDRSVYPPDNDATLF